MNTPVTEDVYQKPRPPSLKPLRLKMRSSVSEPVNQQMPPYLEMLQAEGSQNMREHVPNTGGCYSDVRNPPPLPVKSKMCRASENTPCRPESPKLLPRLPSEELYQSPRRSQFASPQSRQFCIDSSGTTNPMPVFTETSTGYLLMQPTLQYQNMREHAADTGSFSSDVQNPPPIPIKSKMRRASENTPCRPDSPKLLPRLPSEELYQSPRQQFASPQSRQFCIDSSGTTNPMPVFTETSTGYLLMQPTLQYQNMREHAADTGSFSSDVQNPPPIPIKSKMRRASENTPCRPDSPKLLPRLPSEELYQSPRQQFASPQSRQFCIDSSGTTNPMPVFTETSTGYLLMQPTLQYQNMREHAADTGSFSFDVQNPPPIPIKSKMRRASENTPCRPDSPKSLPRLPEQELYQNTNAQFCLPETFQCVQTPYNGQTASPLFTSPVSANQASPVYHNTEEQEFCLPETFQCVQTPYNGQTASPLFTSPVSANEALPVYHNTEEQERDDGWNKLQRSVESHRIMSGLDPLQCLSPETVSRYLTNLAIQMRLALCFFHSMMLISGEKLRSNITELHSIADNLDKVQKSTGLGARAAVKKNKSDKVDRKRLERVVQEYQTNITEVEKHLCFILSGMVQIHSYDVMRLPSLDAEAAWLVRLVDKVYQENASLSSGTFQNQVLNMSVLKAFELWLDIFFTDNGQKVKKGLKSKFGENIRTMARQLQEGLDQVYKMWELFTQFAPMV
ncbi:uncharacterized protein LOC111195574 [Astyanax mexicanus]|uniref:uncharacterized protein LOC111195574 n=1 Tax=Astyanax mexicanus TaxID=7994 RepID=UPI0020CB2337|nr:uncharacterized protein LOC111195574 [Astyanax mexicanus]